jgi:hypothetical protein
MDEPDVRGVSFEARDDPHRGFMDVRGQIFCRIEQPQEALAAHARGRFTGSIPRRNLLIPSALVVGPDSLFDPLTLGSLTTRDRQRCMFRPLGAHTPASRIFRINSFGTGSGFSRRIERVVLMKRTGRGYWGYVGRRLIGHFV